MAPEYLYEDPETGKVVSVIQGIEEDHTYEEDGKKFARVFDFCKKIDATLG